MMMLAVAVGGALGAVVRYALIQWLEKRAQPFYMATFIVNSVGSFLMGMALHLFQSSVMLALFVTGFLGALTTFSTFAFDTVRLLKINRHKAIIYMLLTLIVGFGCIVLGYKIR
ncbi:MULTISPECIES: fluoride efflux transporter FluC [Kurthia]|nr:MULTISPECIES: CrcB family protein [unclassified Kurthia]